MVKTNISSLKDIYKVFLYLHKTGGNLKFKNLKLMVLSNFTFSGVISIPFSNNTVVSNI